MSTQVNFTPSTTALFTFQAQLADGNTYLVATPWNLFGQRYYVSVTDLSGNLLVYRALSASGQSVQGALTWSEGVATVTATVPHNVPVGALADVNVSQTGTAFDGDWQALATGPLTVTYALATNPNNPQPLTGSLNFPLNLVAPQIAGAWLIFNYATQQFEY